FPEPKKGARQTKRRREAWELEIPRVSRAGKDYVALSKRGSTMTCSKCGEKGHNRRGCKAGDEGSSSNRPGGRTPSTPEATVGRQPDTGGSPLATGAGGVRRKGQAGSNMEFMP
ncbi:hypothetical protein LINPERPRIM_LOCUS4893, partial [Linum perenne]